MGLADRVVLITGGGGHIGTAVSLACARLGARVVVTDNRLETAERTATLVRDNGGNSIAMCLDVLDEEQVERAFVQAIEQYGRIDALVNLAGETVIAKSVDCPIADFDFVLRLNVTGQFLMSRAAARRMISSGAGGAIVLVSSILGYGGIPRRAAYSSSRAACINLTRTLAVEWALDKIRVNCVAPGWTRTTHFENTALKGGLNIDALVERTPMGRLANVDEIADVVTFLLSDASRYVTGVTIPVDGGVTAYVGPGGKPSQA